MFAVYFLYNFYIFGIPPPTILFYRYIYSELLTKRYVNLKETVLIPLP